MTNIREQIICSVAMLTVFTLIMTVGYWLRHDKWIWDDLACVEVCELAR